MIVELAARLLDRLRRGDPLARRVGLGKRDFLAAFAKGVICGLYGRGVRRVSEAAFGAIAASTDDTAVREAIRRRVEASGTSFYWAMRLLPPERRYGMYAVYAWCREVDDIADGDQPVAVKLAALDAWRDEIAALYAGHPRQLVARALQEPMRQYELRRHDFLAVIDGMEMDARAEHPRP